MIGSLRRWSALFSEFAFAQVASQAIAAVTGLLLVRTMTIEQFALYTLALGAISFVSVLSDSGVGGSLYFYFRKARVDGRAFAPYREAAARVRQRMLYLAWVAVAAYLVSVASTTDFTLAQVALLAATILATTAAMVHSSFRLTLLRLNARYRQSYLAELSGNVTRLLLVGVLAVAEALRGWTAILATAVGVLVTRRLARDLDPAEAIRPAAGELREREREIFRYILPTLPGSLYFALQGPLVVWMCGHFANVTVMAEVGAVGRLGIILALLSGFVTAVFVPRLASVADDREYRRRYLLGWTLMLASGAAVVALAAWVPHWMVWLLGDSYRGLEREVVIVAFAAVAMAWSGYATAVKHARGWVRNQPFVIVVLVAIQVALVMTLDLSTTAGVLYFQLGSALALLGVELANNAFGFAYPRWVAVDAR